MFRILFFLVVFLSQTSFANIACFKSLSVEQGWFSTRVLGKDKAPLRDINNKIRTYPKKSQPQVDGIKVLNEHFALLPVEHSGTKTFDIISTARSSTKNVDAKLTTVLLKSVKPDAIYDLNDHGGFMVVTNKALESSQVHVFQADGTIQTLGRGQLNLKGRVSKAEGEYVEKQEIVVNGRNVVVVTVLDNFFELNIHATRKNLDSNSIVAAESLSNYSHYFLLLDPITRAVVNTHFVTSKAPNSAPEISSEANMLTVDMRDIISNEIVDSIDVTVSE